MASKTDEKKYRFEIVRNSDGNAPTKWDLSRCLFDGVRFNLTLEFSTTDDHRAQPPEGVNASGKHTVEVILTRVETEDGSHESWNLGGYVTINDEQKGLFSAHMRTNRKADQDNLGVFFFVPSR